MGCYWYAYRGAGVEGRKSAGPDGSISVGEATLSKGNQCENQTTMSLQQDQYLDYLESSQRYHVFLDRLVIVTNSGDALMFQSNTEELETTLKGDLFGRLSTDAGCTGLEVPPGSKRFDQPGESGGHGNRISCNVGSRGFGN